MTDRAALVRLAGLVGIETRYTDALGQTREASDDALLALTAAFGLPSDPAEAAAALAAREEALPFELAPAQIIRGEDPHPILSLRLPTGARAVEWTCRCEGGSEHAGRLEVDPGANRSAALPLPVGLPLGYHRLAVAGGGNAAEVDLIVAPAQCHLPPGLDKGERSWGLTCQLYGLRSAGDCGVGDFSDLGRLAAAAGACGAAVLGVNPLHARFAAEPLHVSPYAPSSRTWLDYLAIDTAAMPGFAEDATVQQLIHGEPFGATRWAARSAALIDYGAAMACKRPVLEALYRRFRKTVLGDSGAAQTDLGSSFRQFQREGGQSLRDFAVFEALQEHHCREARGFAWRNWPAPLRNPRSPEVAEFAAAHPERVEFFEFLQWEADRQLGAAAGAGRDAGLAIGLYRDLAVGIDPNGAEAWADQALIVPQATIGAPPDLLSLGGQDWGLAPVNPLELRAQGFRPFIACLRANMRHAGVLRIDHVMSLNRLYWIPQGMAATEGCYVNYPFEELLRLVALESHRQGCAVIGEDLGTVPPGFRETAQTANLLSYRIMMFERTADGGFIPPGGYPPLAAAAAATHDLPTLRGFWEGCDIAWRRRLGLYPDANANAADAASRVRDRHCLLDALIAEGLLAPEDRSRLLPEIGEPVFLEVLADAVQRYLARSRARLMLAQLEDAVGESEQANLPGTSGAHPNWRRRLGATLEEVIAGGELPRLARLIEAERRRSAAA